jgi:hypothetical protein
MNDADGWARFRERIIEGTQQVGTLRAWEEIAALTRLPEQESIDRLKALVNDQMDEGAFLTFRNAMVLVNSVYSQRAGLPGIQDQTEWLRRYNAYLAGPDAEAPQYDRYWSLRATLDAIRKPKEQAPPYDAEEFALAEQCNVLFNELAILLIQASPAAASQKVLDALAMLIARYRNLLAETRPENRSRRQVFEAIASATYATGRTHLILKDYPKAKQFFQSALEAYAALGDLQDAQVCRQQLAALSLLGGNVDAAMRANLEVLTAQKEQPRSLDRASALVSQLKQTLNGGDTFEARKLLSLAVAELNRQLYPDPGKEEVDQAFALWIEMIPAGLVGNIFFMELANVTQLYGGILGARATLDLDVRAEEQLRALSAIVDRTFHESLNADEDLQRRFMLANARPLALPRTAEAT